MKKYVITYEERKGGSGIIGGKYFDSFSEACEYLKKYLEIEDGEETTDNFGGDADKGTFYDEEMTLEVIEINGKN